MSQLEAALPAPRAHAYPRRWLAAAVMIVAALMDMIDATIVNVALPTIRSDLGASATQVEWIVAAYLLPFASLLLIAGRLGDLVGRRRLFLAGTALFGAASAVCAVAGSPGVLIVARAAEGAAAAMLTPQVLATFREIFEGEERGAAFGMYGAMAGFAAAVGVIAGGLLTDGLGWRSIFYINVPVAAVLIPAALALVPETRSPTARRPSLLGSVGLLASLVAIVAPLLEGRRLGWPAWCFALIALGLAGLFVLARTDGRRTAPLIPTRLFRVPAFSAGVLVQALFSAAMEGFALCFALWLQAGQGYSPTHAGLTMLAFCAGSFIAVGPAVSLAPKVGRLVLSAGGVLMAAGSLGIGLVAHHSGTPVGTWALVPWLVVAGVGLGFLVIPLVNVVLSAIGREEAGEASGVFGTAQQFGGALGVAAAGTVFFAHVSGPTLTSALTAAMPLVIGAYALCALLVLLLPNTAIMDADV
jgi:EmrB/QacA subfamily drug resistance transporter